MKYQIEVRRSAAKALKKVAARERQAIANAIDDLATNPRPRGVRKLAGGTNEWRIRVGPYRVVYEIWDAKLVVLVVRVAHRRDVYR